MIAGIFRLALHNDRPQKLISSKSCFYKVISFTSRQNDICAFVKNDRKGVVFYRSTINSFIILKYAKN